MVLLFRLLKLRVHQMEEIVVVSKLNRKPYGVFVGIIGVILSWAIMADSSPLRNIVGSKIASMFGVLNFPVYGIIVVLDLPEFATYFVLFAYWFLIGTLICWALRRVNLADPK